MRICNLRMGASCHGWSLVGAQRPVPGSAARPAGSPEPGSRCPLAQSSPSPLEIKDGVASLSDSGGSTIFRAKTKRKNLNAPLFIMAVWDLIGWKSSSETRESKWVIISPCYWSIGWSSLHASLVCDLCVRLLWAAYWWETTPDFTKCLWLNGEWLKNATLRLRRLFVYSCFIILVCYRVNIRGHSS